MALVVGEWVFATGEAPDLRSVCDGLIARTELVIRTEGEGSSAVLSIPKLGERLFDWRARDDCLTVHAFGPPHPYLWENLDAVLAALGGQVGDNLVAWRPAPADAGLRRPWPSLSRRQRTFLRIPTIGVSRPFDELVRSRRPLR